MVGHTTATETRIWVKASGPTKLIVRISESPDLENAMTFTGPALAAESDFMGHVVVTGLKPSTTYHYAVCLDEPVNTVIARPYPSFTTAPPDDARGRTRFAFVSCLGRDAALPAAAWGDMAERTTFDLLLMLGDNHYADTTDPAKQRAAYFAQRRVAAYGQIAARTPTYAIWDDHDYGPNNSDGTALGKEASLRTFQQHFANPAYGLPEAPGCFFKFSRAGIDFFMLDSRYHRTPNRMPDEPGKKTMLGEAQLKWLKESLVASKAPVKVIACGSEFQTFTHKDCWGGFTHERRELFDFIKNNNITGVLLLSGDRHFTAAYQVEGRFIEVTSGPLGSKNYPSKNLPEMFINYGEGKLYCVYDIDTSATPHPRVTLEIYRASEGLIHKRPFTWDEINGVTKIAPLPPTPETPKP